MSKSGSGKAVIQILVKYFSFQIVSQKGSHVKLRKDESNPTITTIVPIHRELARGTLRSVLKLAEVDFEEFQDYL